MTLENTNQTDTHPTPIDPASLNSAPLSGINLPISKATGGRIKTAKELFERLFVAENKILKQEEEKEWEPLSFEETHNKKDETHKTHETNETENDKNENKTEKENHEQTETIKEPPKKDLNKSEITIIPHKNTPPPVMIPAKEIFPEISAENFGFWGEIPIATWPNGREIFPHVPKKQPHYSLENGPAPAEIILAIITNTNIMITGPTGSGKSTSVEEIAARTGRPYYRINFDGELRRPELLGHHMQKVTENGSYIEWQPGILQSALAWPSLITFDEYDRGDPDLIYAIHELLEGKNLKIAEEGDMTIIRHPECRISATANTKGAGESNGLYADDTRQSEASRNRFGYWTEHKYMTAAQERNFLLRCFPTIKPENAKLISDVAEDLRNNFLKNDITSSCSTRQTKLVAADLALALKYNPEMNRNKQKEIIKKSMERVIIGRATDPAQEAKMLITMRNRGLN